MALPGRIPSKHSITVRSSRTSAPSSLGAMLKDDSPANLRTIKTSRGSCESLRIVISCFPTYSFRKARYLISFASSPFPNIIRSGISLSGLGTNLTPVCSPKCSIGIRRTKMPRAAPSYKPGGPRKRRSDGEDWIMDPSMNGFCARSNMEKRPCHRPFGVGARHKAPGTLGEPSPRARLVVGPSLELAVSRQSCCAVCCYETDMRLRILAAVAKYLNQIWAQMVVRCSHLAPDVNAVRSARP
jgi:hypothetical protein